jgi:hypothetical protein
MDGLYVSIAFKDLLGNLKEEEFKKMDKLSVDVDDKYCGNCNVRLDIVCNEVGCKFYD